MSAIVRVTAEGVSSGQPCVNVYHWEIPLAAPATEMNGIIGALQTFYNAVKGYLNSGNITIGSRCVTVDQNPNAVVPGTPVNVTTTGGAIVTAGTSAVISWSTPFIGRSYRGRTYLGPISTTAGTAQDGHNILTAAQTAINTAAATLMGFTTNGVSMVLWSPRLNVATGITGVIVRTNLGTQRRRTSL